MDNFETNLPRAETQRYASGNWEHFFDADMRPANCRIVIDLEQGTLIAAQVWTGLTYHDVLGERLEHLAESVIEVNEAHIDSDIWFPLHTAELPTWADKDRKYPQLHKYSFSVKLVAEICVSAASLDDAIRLLADTLESINNDGEKASLGCSVVQAISTQADTGPVLMTIDGAKPEADS